MGNKTDIDVDMAEVLDLWLNNRLLSVHTVLVGKIEAFDRGQLKCNVQPVNKMPFPGGQFVDAPLLQGVPVMIPGSSEMRNDFEIPDGTGCIVLISENGIGNWLKGATEPNADSTARFKLTDAMAIPGLFPYGQVPEGRNKTTQTGGDVSVTTEGTHKIDATAIEFNGNAKPFVTHAELDAALQAMVTLINAHVHFFPATATAPTSPPTVPTTVDISASATTTVKTGG